jgi:hypothetical protein
MKIKDLDKKPQKATVAMDPTSGGKFFSILRTKEDGSQESVRPDFSFNKSLGSSIRQNVIDGKLKEAEVVPSKQELVTTYKVVVAGLTVCEGETREVVAQ